MSLQEQINDDLKTAMKSGEKERLRTLRMVKTELSKRTSEGKKKESLSDDEVLEVLNKLVKQRRESIEEYEDAGRDELVEEEKEELAIIKEYLPDIPDDGEIEETIEQVIEEEGASDMRDMGTVMKKVMSQFEGVPVDGSEINEKVREKLTGA